MPLRLLTFGQLSSLLSAIDPQEQITSWVLWIGSCCLFGSLLIIQVVGDAAENAERIRYLAYEERKERGEVDGGDPTRLVADKHQRVVFGGWFVVLFPFSAAGVAWWLEWSDKESWLALGTLPAVFTAGLVGVLLYRVVRAAANEEGQRRFFKQRNRYPNLGKHQTLVDDLLWQLASQRRRVYFIGWYSVLLTVCSAGGWWWLELMRDGKTPPW